VSIDDHRVRAAAWLDGERIRAYATVMLVGEAALFAFLVAVSYGAFHLVTAPNTTDFVSFYAAGVQLWHGDATAVYDSVRHLAAEQRALGFGGFHYFYFFYPPIFLVVCALLPLLPYLAAYAAWLAATGAGFVWVVSTIAGVRGSWRVLAAFPPVFIVFGTGQNSFLTAACFGVGTWLLDRRPFLAGLCFGVLCLKPQLAVLLPVALLAGRNWRAIAGAATAAVGLAAASLLAFGVEAWRAFFVTFSTAPNTFGAGDIDLDKLINPFGAVLLVGGAPRLARAVQAAATLIAAAVVALVWWRRERLDIRAAVLAAASLVAAPILLDYDLCFAAIAGVWLVRGAERHGWLAMEVPALAVLFVLCLFTRPVAEQARIPLACLIALALFGLAIRRAFTTARWRWRRGPAR
jgi:hypothetical protein